MNDEWFDDFLGISPDDLAEIAQDAEEALTEEEERQQSMLGLVAFTIDEVVKINNALDDDDLQALAASIDDFVRSLNAQVRARGWDPIQGIRYAR